MIEIIAKSSNEAVIGMARLLLSHGQLSSPRGLKTLELTDVFIEITDPTQTVITLPERNLNMDYLKKELEWYQSGDLNAQKICEASKFWEKIQNPDGTVNSNYGYFCDKQLINGKSQFQWCIDAFTRDPDTRQAVINYNQPMHKYENNRDFVCTMFQQFRKNASHSLETRVFMRSNDMIYGFSYDVPWFTYVQKRLADTINSGLGSYFHYAASMHVYEKHFNMLEKIANAKI